MLFPEINVEKTSKNVSDFLDHYHTIRRMAGEPVPHSMTSVLSETPKSAPIGNTAEKNIFDQLESQEILHAIHSALACLSSESRRLIWEKYIVGSSRYNYERYEEMGISRPTYNRWLDSARVEFAEAYNHGELLVFR